MGTNVTSNLSVQDRFPLQLQNSFESLTFEDVDNLHDYSDIDLFIWGFTSLSTLYRSYHDG